MKMNKKAQFYPIFIAAFLLVTLSFAYVSLSGTKKICKEPGQCDRITIGSLPSQIFFTLQDADTIQYYLDQSARIAVEKSMSDLKYSCTYKDSFESSDPDDTSPCGKHVYPLWSTKEELCLPDCKYSFEGLFHKNLNYELSKYYLVTGITLPASYDVDVKTEGGATYIAGISKSPIQLNSYSVNARQLLEKDPAVVSATETKLREARAEEAKATPTPTLAPPPTVPPSSPPASSSGEVTLSWPTSGAKQINSCFGFREISGGSQYHAGIDIQSNDMVLSPAPGVVEEAGDPSKPDSQIFQNGNLVDPASCWGRVVINHGGGIKTVFLHLQEVNVKAGQTLKTGEVIGRAGGRGRSGTHCSNTQYATHIHMDVLYNGLPSGIPSAMYIRAGHKANYIQRTSLGNAINPLCLLDASGARISDNKNCGYPINTDLAVVCPKYGLNNPTLYASSPTFDNSITAAAVLKSKKLEAPDAPSLSTGTYSFSPSFSVRLNKNLDDPLKEVTTWAEATWNTCTDDVKKCLDTKVVEQNAKTDKVYTLKQASECEEKPADFFYDFMEAMEDSLSNGQAGCFMDFNASSYSFAGNLVITLDGTTASLAAGEIGKTPTPVEGVKYTLFSGDFDSDAIPYKEIKFSFKDDFSIERIIVTGFSLNDAGEKVETPISDGIQTVRIVKLLGKEGVNNLGEFIAADNTAFPACLPRKEKFRLCAVPDSKFTSLFTVKFAMQFKDEPPKKECKSAEITVTPEQKKIDSFVEDIATIKGFDVIDLFSAIPIPALQFAGMYIGIADIVANLPAQQSAKLIITVKSTDPDVVSYNVYCSDLPAEVSSATGVSVASSPQSVAVIEATARELEVRTSGVDSYVKTSPYTKFLDKEDCKVPTIDKSGIVRKVQGVKATKEGDITSFTVAQCSGASVAIDKLLKKEYCITLVPVDKQGRENRDCAITNCGKTNALLDMAIKKFLETKLRNAMVIPADVIPTELSPYFKLPDQNDFIDAALGRRSMDFSDVVNMEGLQNQLTGDMRNFVMRELNKDVVGAAFVETFNNLDGSKQQAILAGVSSQLDSQTANLLLNQFVQGRNVEGAARQAVLGKATDYIKDEDARAVLNEFTRTGDPQTAAFNALQRQATQQFTAMTEEQKRQTLVRAANSPQGTKIRDKIQDAAAQTGCASGQLTSTTAALNCLPDRQLNAVYRQAIIDRDPARAILSSQLEKIDNVQARSAVAQLAQTRDFEGTARDALLRQVESMDASKKLDLMQEVMRGNGIPERAIQSEMMKMLPNTNMQLLNNVLQNRNIQSLLENQLRDSLTRQLNSFINQECVEHT